MPDPISSSCPHYTPAYDDPIGEATQRYCKNADSVTSGYLCNEPTVGSYRMRAVPQAAPSMRSSATTGRWPTYNPASGATSNRWG
jgi:hypothetical protein